MPREINLVLDNAGYYRHVDELFQLTDVKTTFEAEFSNVGEDVTLKLLAGEFGAGLEGPYNVYFDNVSITEVTAPVASYKFDFDNNMALDGAFNIWESDEWSGGGAGTMIQENGLLTVDVTSTGLAYSPQVYQDGMLFENGETYLVSFTGSADASKTINLSVGRGLDYDPWWLPYVDTHTYVLESTPKDYYFVFKMNEETFDNGKLVFELGTVGGDDTKTTVYLDNINVAKLSDMTDDSLWTLWERDEWSGNGAGTLTTLAVGFTVDVTSTGAAYSPQVYQDGMTFVNGMDYLVMFTASSPLPKTVNVNIGRGLDYDPWWLAYAGTETYVFGDENTYIYSFTMNEETFDNGKMVFELGEINGDTTTTTVDVRDIFVVGGARLLTD